MDTDKIKAVMLAAELGSLSRAAEALSYTPSAMSHIADALDAELGVRLLCRSASGVRWSEDGERLLERLGAIVRAEEDLTAAASELSEGGEIRIVTYSSISHHILPEILRGFKRRHPNVRVIITVSNHISGWLSDGRADVSFSDGVGIGKGEEWVPILTDRYSAVLPLGVLEGRESVEREELYGFPYISTAESSLKKYFDESRFHEVTSFVSVDDESVVSMVREGLGVAVLPSLVLGDAPRGVRIARLEPPFARTLGFSYRRRDLGKRAIAQFVKYLKYEYTK